MRSASAQQISKRSSCRRNVTTQCLGSFPVSVDQRARADSNRDQHTLLLNRRKGRRRGPLSTRPLPSGVRSASDPRHLVRDQGVAGSNPVSPTNFWLRFRWGIPPGRRHRAVCADGSECGLVLDKKIALRVRACALILRKLRSLPDGPTRQLTIILRFRPPSRPVVGCPWRSA